MSGSSDIDINKSVEGRGSFITSFGLLERLKKPDDRLNIVPVIDLLSLALLISLLFTRFVISPGVEVGLPATDLKMRHSVSAVSVLTLGNGGMLFFDGSVYEAGSIGRAFRRHIERLDKTEAVLLIKAESNIELQTFLDLCKMAQDAGFAKVQVAGELPEEAVGVSRSDLAERERAAVFPVVQ